MLRIVEQNFTQDLTPEQRLEELGLELPPVSGAVGAYAPWMQVGNVIYTSGQLPWVDGDLKYTGKMGAELTVQDGYQAFLLSALNGLAQLQDALGSLNRVRRILRVEGTAHTTPDFTEQPAALDGASDLVNAVFGERGRHTRMIYSDTAMCLNCATLVVLWAEVDI
ncbi:RidA family protein [Epibacterium sp. Ofav1-8]|uniref:RidA family protein n=1 Tax=Epibacterium sp. Ofav1-8 TaxID=2917735 RepID=UPI001EF6C651|nr:RidA family protein [Epibacterium sp. Ofav1-8]MCG7625327.1 RidA family protein [Epibacterium sp. Ofav1-8]